MYQASPLRLAYADALQNQSEVYRSFAAQRRFLFFAHAGNQHDCLCHGVIPQQVPFRDTWDSWGSQNCLPAYGPCLAVRRTIGTRI